MLTGGATVATSVARRPENHSMITSTAFTVYAVSNMERARAFYEHVLGLHVSYHRHHDDKDGPYSGNKGSNHGL
jgi:Glyoxalase/Bleomycin resistance protein/Dioxygenase superfamily.